MGFLFRMTFRQLVESPVRTFWSIACIVLSTAISLSIFLFYLIFDSVLSAALNETAHVDILSGLSQVNTNFNTVFMLAYIFTLAFSVLVFFTLFRTGAVKIIRHLDILKSVGSSRAQLRRTVMAEAAILAIPGLALGVVLAFLFVHFALHHLQGFLQPFVYATGINLAINPTLYWEATFLSVAILAAVITLSSWLAARQSVKMVEDGIFSSAGASLFSMRSISGLEHAIKKIFGIEGVLAYRNLVRGAPDFPTIMISFVVTVALMIGMFSSEPQIQNAFNIIAADIDAMEANVMLGFYTSVDESDAVTVPPYVAESMMDVFHGFPQTSVLGIGRGAQQFSVEVSKDMFSEVGLARNPGLFDHNDTEIIPVNLIAIDAAHYAQLAQRAGVPAGANILINYCRLRMDLYCDLQPDSDECLRTDCRRDNFWHEFSAFNFEPRVLSLLCGEGGDSSEPVELFVEGDLQRCELPVEIRLFIAVLNTFTSDYSGTHMTILMPTIESSFVTYFVQVEDEKGFIDFAVDAVKDSKEMNAFGTAMVVADFNYAHEALQGAEEVVSVFAYGLIGLFILFGVVILINIVYANIGTHARDTAVAISSGMNVKSLCRVANWGVIAYMGLALAVGIPLGIALSWLTYVALPNNLNTAYVLPWSSVARSVVDIVLMTLIIMYFTSRKLAKSNPLETIRQFQN